MNNALNPKKSVTFMPRGTLWALTWIFIGLAAVMIFFGVLIKVQSVHAVKTYTATTTATLNDGAKDRSNQSCSGSGTSRTCTTTRYCRYTYTYSPLGAEEKFTGKGEDRGTCSDQAFQPGAQHVVHYDPHHASKSTTVDVSSSSQQNIWLVLAGLGVACLIVVVGVWIYELRGRAQRRLGQ